MINNLKHKFCIHGDFIWENPNGDPIPMMFVQDGIHLYKVIRVCGRCGERKTQYWGRVGGEVLENW